MILEIYNFVNVVDSRSLIDHVTDGNNVYLNTVLPQCGCIQALLNYKCMKLVSTFECFLPYSAHNLEVNKSSIHYTFINYLH